MKNKINFVTAMLLLLISACVSAPTQKTVEMEPPGRIEHNGQELFLSGMNLAWISFGRDLTMFNEEDFVGALDELAASGANSVRWWIHVNGSSTPQWDGHMVSGMPEGTLDNLERALDLAWERGILIMPCLWSFDMLQEQAEMDPIRNKQFLEDNSAVESYLDNALTPMIERVGKHPAVVAWEVFNEPEGMVEGIGWAKQRTSMERVQYFVNRVAGRIHQIDSTIKVTNGTKDMSTQTDIKQYTNYYSDERLIAVGGDELGYLDFYQVHYYPKHMGESLSPFHNPKSHWELDKELLIGEFPAVGMVDYGHGYLPETTLTPEESYLWAEKMGYAGAMAWTWTAHEAELGSLTNVQPGLMNLAFSKRSAIKVDNGDVDWIPERVGSIERLLIPFNSEPIAGYADLKTIFKDKEDGVDLSYSVEDNSAPEVVEVTINDGFINLNFLPDASGKVTVTFAAEDRAGNVTKTDLELLVVDPDKGNIALFKPVTTSSVESETHKPEMMNDGSSLTRYSSEYENDQWLIIDLEGLFKINAATVTWEAAYGREYKMYGSLDGEEWFPLFDEVEGQKGLNEYSFDVVDASYIKMDLIKRGTDWGFSIFELEVLGERVK